MSKVSKNRQTVHSIRLQKECIRKKIYKTRDLVRADIFDYIEVFYNRARRQSGGL